MAPAIVNATLQATFLAALSNGLAQALQAYRAARPLAIDPAPIFHFVILTLITVPPNYLWQMFLEDTFPSHTVAPEQVKGVSKSSSELVPQKKFNVGNFIAKLILDQTLSAFINTLAFIAIMNALQGANGEEIVLSMKRDWQSLMIAGAKVWPLVSVICLGFIPAEQRIVFASVVGVGWNVFLSLFVSE